MTSTTGAIGLSTFGGSTFIPTLENHFGLSIAQEYDPDCENPLVWQNPYLNLAITPYIPSGDKELVASCQTVFNDMRNSSVVTLDESIKLEVFLWTNDVSVLIFSQLDLVTLSSCSKVSKCFHWITKASFIWAKQLTNLLPNVKPLKPEVCIFSTQQQFQIIYTKINDYKKPYFARFDRIKETSLTLKNELKQVTSKFIVFGGPNALTDATQKLNDLFIENRIQNDWFQQRVLWKDLEQTEEFQALYLSKQMIHLKSRINSKTGENFDGSIASIHEGSELARVLNAINFLIPSAIDNQEQFEKVIQQSEAQMNTASLS